ncbi:MULTISPECIES: hypothetical protein [unclassified Streptomyces]|uniref:hypothetical protein n=1 Tax=unclassified Streptomyces TaxID=2593676 RepID=UPI00214C3B0B|nr:MULTISPECIES: hypothetical protein [unclassified Streptomyces]MCX5009480.1 hypothetical protein [Streptomyces sp. NBC_00555]MCX5612541.1 hypothetical protein [Streptomyces sp. NBC_00047]UUU44930.1 hypothetical protein JIW86_02635 [Streptomyces sp. NBC_00162]
MTDEYRTRELMLPAGTATILGTADMDLTDAELLERYPRVAEILARWEQEVRV